MFYVTKFQLIVKNAKYRTLQKGRKKQSILNQLSTRSSKPVNRLNKSVTKGRKKIINNEKDKRKMVRARYLIELKNANFFSRSSQATWLDHQTIFMRAGLDAKEASKSNISKAFKGSFYLKTQSSALCVGMRKILSLPEKRRKRALNTHPTPCQSKLKPQQTDTSQNEPTPNPIGNKPTKQVDNSEVSVLNTLSSQGGDSTKQVSVLQPKHSKQHRLSLAHFCGKRPQVHFSHALTCHMAVEVCKADLSYLIT